MATTKKPAHRYLGSSELLAHADGPELFPFEFDESEVWPTNDVIVAGHHEAKGSNNKVNRPLRKPKAARDRDIRPMGPKSLPVNVPDWSKILPGECRRRGGGLGFDAYEDADDGEGFDGNDIIPPHEYLARTRVASFSVHEGAGRTLKGMDLSRVRNAIWKQIGFED